MGRKLSMPVVCSCGYATMDAGEAVRHIREKHPEEWVEDVRFREALTVDDARALAFHGEDD